MFNVLQFLIELDIFESIKINISSKKFLVLHLHYFKGGGADVPLFETIKTNAGTQPKNELQL